MTVRLPKLTKKTAVLIIAAAAALLAVLIIVLSAPSGGALSTTEERVAYLAALGWEADPASETVRETVLPREFSDVLEKYNELQLSQNFDLRPYAGMPCTLYTYALQGYPGGSAEALLILCEGRVIGGDIHSCALNGFMHSLK